ncbi:branched-chain amino acid ABC transporter permease [Limobrevibacterium gyesilva]|uniref:Branched-chain amino acid ABC transporter permease n=1 Tax=Limobrevibacterium gyesilva TaxID=2991712 RepID=A0AA41YJ54_9PROT|nr:branched-chain amino acid ABC transporter permease [Limobrevibacterium gyesilva]MCW3473505.1 branched-chain amino acid ABC transporter permease [Limobrevibacterium gyesilva]
MNRLVPLLAFAALAAVPFIPFGREGGYVLLLVSRVMVFALAAISLDLLLGGGGMVSFGHAAYLAIGAYAVAILDANDVSEAWAVLAAALGAAALFAAGTGAVALRTRGVNFIMITLAFAQMVYFAAGSLAAYGGDDGYSLIARTELFGWPVLKGRGFYATAFVLLLAGYLLCRMLVASRFGRVLRAIRQNRQRVQAMGFNPFTVQLTAMVIAGMLCAVAGVLLANLSEFASPAYATWQRSGDLLIMVILGGAGSLHGALLGAAFVVLLEEALGRLTEHWRLIFGPLLVLSVLYFRGGLAGIGAKRD